MVRGRGFRNATGYGLTPGQFYQRPAIKQRNLQGVGLNGDLTGWDFSGQNLTGAFLRWANLTNTNLSWANLTNASLWDARLAGTNFSAAVVAGADFRGSNSGGLSKSQLYSTASYHARDLRGIILSEKDLSDWNFRRQDLTGADLSHANLTDADLTGANLTDARLILTKLTNASFAGAIVTGASYLGGIKREQLYSTASYQTGDLRRISIVGSSESDWSFRGQDLTGAKLSLSLSDGGLSASRLANANLRDIRNLDSSVVDTSTAYNQWTVFPTGFDPLATAMNYVPSPAGDLDANDILNAADVDSLVNRIYSGFQSPSWFPDAAFDVNTDEEVTQEDLRVWVKELARTWYGDADINGEFNSSDMVQVFVAGKYEERQFGPCSIDGPGCSVSTVHASWSEGDWNGDGVFDSADFVIAFQDGGYEQGPRADAVAVPEPSAGLMLLLGIPIWLLSRRAAVNTRARHTHQSVVIPAHSSRSSDV